MSALAGAALLLAVTIASMIHLRPSKHERSIRARHHKYNNWE